MSISAHVPPTPSSSPSMHFHLYTVGSIAKRLSALTFILPQQQKPFPTNTHIFWSKKNKQGTLLLNVYVEGQEKHKSEEITDNRGRILEKCVKGVELSRQQKLISVYQRKYDLLNQHEMKIQFWFPISNILSPQRSKGNSNFNKFHSDIMYRKMFIILKEEVNLQKEGSIS